MSDKRNIIVNEIYEAQKPDFMDKKRLAEELCCSEDYIEGLMRDKVLVKDRHYTRNKRFVRFYYPEVRKTLMPELCKQEA
jgi:hypothetical protein